MGIIGKMKLSEINAYNCPDPSLEPPDCWKEEPDFLDEEGEL